MSETLLHGASAGTSLQKGDIISMGSRPWPWLVRVAAWMTGVVLPERHNFWRITDDPTSSIAPIERVDEP